MRNRLALPGGTIPALIAMLLALSAAACSDDEGGGGGTSGGPETPSITVGVLPIVDVAPLYIAQQAGYFEQEGLEVSFQPAQGGAALIPAMVGGDVHIAFSNYVSLFLARSQGLDVTVVAEGNRATTGFSGVLVLPDSPIKEPADLVGKKVAVNTLKNIGHLSLAASLDSVGVDVDGLEQVEVGFPQMGPTLERGDVDAVWVVQPFTTVLKQTLDAREVIDAFSGAAEGLPVAGYAVTSEFAQDNPRTVAAFLRALRKAVDDIAADPGTVADVLPTYTSITAELATDVVLPEFVAEPEVTELQRVADLMVEFGLLSEPLEVAELVSSG